ncbi:hypothetical protein MRB53_035588 [Persea americana]|uniref:Uncharacterized protein n=1 Tax=Persea americana TaxID=3435 RepID=A0ACC2K525_PERAE|nr:hypothetical protein MRB53_035588 [Persea americana]
MLSLASALCFGIISAIYIQTLNFRGIVEPCLWFSLLCCFIYSVATRIAQEDRKVNTEFCKSIGADGKQRQGLI